APFIDEVKVRAVLVEAPPHVFAAERRNGRVAEEEIGEGVSGVTVKELEAGAPLEPIEVIVLAKLGAQLHRVLVPRERDVVLNLPVADVHRAEKARVAYRGIALDLESRNPRSVNLALEQLGDSQPLRRLRLRVRRAGHIRPAVPVETRDVDQAAPERPRVGHRLTVASERFDGRESAEDVGRRGG